MSIEKINLPIYRLTSNIDEKASIDTVFYQHKNTFELIDIPLFEMQNKTYPIKITQQYMLDRYNLKLSDREISIFLSHIYIWDIFSQSSANYCVILEEHVTCNISLAQLNAKISALPDGWEVFFPFDKSINPSGDGEDAYELGYYWGSCVYFISKKGVQRLKQLEIIDRPLDDYLLSLAMNNQLEMHCQNTHFFNVNFDLSMAHPGRLISIQHAVSTYQVWSLSNRKLVRKLLQILEEICQKTNINLILHGGTLLGHIQHGEIIPWDDDIDLGINNADLMQLKTAILSDGRLKIASKTEEKNGIDFYKIWSEEGEDIENQHYKFPFIDLWPYTKQQMDIVFHNGVVFPNALLQDFKKVNFETSNFYIPANCHECLDAMYSRWRVKFIIYTWSHRLEKIHFKPFQTSIVTDFEGKFLSYKAG